MMSDPSVHAKGRGGGARGQNLVFLHTLFFLIDYFVW